MTHAIFLLSLCRETAKHPSGLKTERFAASAAWEKKNIFGSCSSLQKCLKYSWHKTENPFYRRRLS